MLTVIVGKSAVDVGKADPDAILVTLEGVEVDGLSEVRRQQLLTLGLQPLPIGSQLSQRL